MIVKLATYNIQFGYGQDGRYDLARIATALQDQDIVCVQEATTFWQACERDHQPDLLSQSLNLYAAYAPAFEIDGGGRQADGTPVNARRGFGNMVLSRWPIVYSRPHSLPRPKVEVPPKFHPNVNLPRTALETVIQINGKDLRVVSLHLSHLPGAQRQAQIETLKALAGALPLEAPLWEDDPRTSLWSEGQTAPDIPAGTLFLGDFNFKPGSDDHARMTAPLNGQAAGLIDAWEVCGQGEAAAGTCVLRDGGLARLDYMFATPDLSGKIASARVDHSTKASDHYPVYFTLEI